MTVTITAAGTAYSCGSHELFPVSCTERFMLFMLSFVSSVLWCPRCSIHLDSLLLRGSLFYVNWCPTRFSQENHIFFPKVIWVTKGKRRAPNRKSVSSKWVNQIQRQKVGKIIRQKASPNIIILYKELEWEYITLKDSSLLNSSSSNIKNQLINSDAQIY